ncbi:hypothetical protein BHE74_00005399, partial [Ensete ventricosum]
SKQDSTFAKITTVRVLFVGSIEVEEDDAKVTHQSADGTFVGQLFAVWPLSRTLFLKCEGEIIKAASMVVAGDVGADLKWWIHGTLARWSWCLLGWTQMPVPATFCRPRLSITVGPSRPWSPPAAYVFPTLNSSSGMGGSREP